MHAPLELPDKRHHRAAEGQPMTPKARREHDLAIRSGMCAYIIVSPTIKHMCRSASASRSYRMDFRMRKPKHIGTPVVMEKASEQFEMFAWLPNMHMQSMPTTPTRLPEPLVLLRTNSHKVKMPDRCPSAFPTSSQCRPRVRPNNFASTQPDDPSQRCRQRGTNGRAYPTSWDPNSACLRCVP